MISGEMIELVLFFFFFFGGGGGGGGRSIFSFQGVEALIFPGTFRGWLSSIFSFPVGEALLIVNFA